MLKLDMTYLLISREQGAQEKEILLTVSNAFNQNFEDLSEIAILPDIHILQIEEKQSIGIEEVKDFQNEMVYKPFQEKKQFGIIFESEKLTHQAQNALLKTLEESDDSTVYLLCVNNEKNLLQTIISRSKPIYLQKLETETVTSEEDSKPEILDMNLVEKFSQIETLGKDKKGALELINSIEKHYQKMLKNEIIESNIQGAKDIKKQLEIISECRTKINANGNKRMVLEYLVIALQSE